MTTIVIPKKEYLNLMRRQMRIEKELCVLRKVLQAEIGEERIRPAALKRWDRISRDLDRGKGRSFASVREMRAGLQIR